MPEFELPVPPVDHWLSGIIKIWVVLSKIRGVVMLKNERKWREREGNFLSIKAGVQKEKK